MDLATNRFKKQIREDVRGQIILLPTLQLSNQVYAKSVDAVFADGEARQLFILNTSATAVKHFLDCKDFTKGFTIRLDRSIMPTNADYKIKTWPNDPDEVKMVTKILKAQVIFKQEFLYFNPCSLLPGSKKGHPSGFRTLVRKRAELAKRKTPCLFRGLTLSYQIWLDYLGDTVIDSLTVSIQFNFHYIIYI